MSRLAAPTRPPLARRATLALLRRMYGRGLDPQAVLAHHGGVFWSGLVHEALVLHTRHHLPPSLRDLVAHRVSVVVGCSWCIDFAAMLALRTGLTPERLRAATEGTTSPLLSDLEKEALAFADAATATPPAVTDDQVARLRAALGDRGLVELAHLVALENHRSRLNHALGLTAQGFTDPAVCALPAPGPASDGRPSGDGVPGDSAAGAPAP